MGKPRLAASEAGLEMQFMFAIARAEALLFYR